MTGTTTSRRIVPLTGEALDHLPDGCRDCLFWELGHPRPDPRRGSATVPAGGPDRGDEPAGDPAAQKQAWSAWQALAGNPPGRVVYAAAGARRGGRELTQGARNLAAYVLFAAPGTCAARKPPVPQTSDDALLLATIWVDPDHREQGLGRLLVQSAVREGIRLGLPAVEVYGDRRWRARHCVLPLTWLLREGFDVAREHPRYPLLRLDVKRTARWADSIEHAIEEVLGRLPRPAPEPVPEGRRRMMPR